MKGIMDMLFIQKIFTNILYMAFIASFVAIILLLRKIFDKKISPMWKFAMWILLLISLIIPFRITLYSSNEQLNTIVNFTNYIEKIKVNFTYNYYGKILTYIWLLGMTTFAIVYIFNVIKMKLKIGKEEIKEERILKILDEAKQSLKIKRNIKLINQKNKIVPCIYGFLQPKILLTQEILEKPDDVLKYIFMHELSHYKRKDTFLNFILLLITFVYWFNPILWFCFKQIRQDMELKADELVIKNIPHNKDKEYAKALVSLLPISKEEKITNRLLYVTDSKKNMERRIKMIKLSDKFKEYKALIGITTLTLTLCIGLLVFTQIKPSEEVSYNNVKYFETPDRIVYKIKNEDKYYVYEPSKEDYNDLINQLTKCIDGVGEGAKLLQDDIKKIEKEESYIELDYNTISKNYIIAFQKENYNVIKRTDEGGIVVKNNIKYKENLEKLLEKQTSKKQECYGMLDSKEYRILEPIYYQVPSWSNELKKYEQGIYSVKLTTKQALENFKENNNINMSQDIPEEQFEKTNVIATITKYQIDKIETRIGGVTLYFKGMEKTGEYYVNLFCLSKAININCIYRNFNDVTYSYDMQSVQTKSESQQQQQSQQVQTSQAQEQIQSQQTQVQETQLIKYSAEDIKSKLAGQKEITAYIKQIKQSGQNIYLTCRITWWDSNQNAQNFEGEILVKADTQIMGSTQSQLQELQKMQKRQDTLYVTLQEKEQQKGNLVAKNIEVMGC